MSRARRVVAGGVASALMLSVAAFPVLAIGDGLTPVGECANSTSAVGTPQGGPNPGITQAEPIVGPNEGGGAVSANNPGVSTGARGDAYSDPNCQSIA